jgi:hypothetical protein
MMSTTEPRLALRHDGSWDLESLAERLGEELVR